MSHTLAQNLEILSLLPGGPGFEGPVRAHIAEKLSEMGVESVADRMGNLVCRVRGQGTNSQDRALHFDAHTDEPAFMVRHIDPRGLIYVAPTGYFVLETVVGQRVRILTKANASDGIRGCFCVCSFHGGSAGAGSVEDLWIDVGAASADEVAAMGIKPGNLVVFDAPFVRLEGKRVMGKAFDDRAGCAVLLEAIKTLAASSPPVDVFFSFSAQEEFLVRGAQVVFNTIKAAYHVVPKVSISLDIGVCGTVGGGETRLSPIEMGKGPGIKLRDKSGVSHYSHVTDPVLVEIMEDIARKNAIPFQYDFLAGCTNAEIFACQECGVYAGGLGFAARNTHSPVEIVDLGDLEATADFVVALVRGGDAFNRLP